MSDALKYVDHTYRDFSNYTEDGGELIKHKKSGNNFPARLHKILSDPSHSDVITWMPHGRAWRVIDRERLVKDVLPGYYVCKKYESFTRQLNGWGFKRLHQHGPDFGCYYHECFLRDIPEITCLIRRLTSKLGKAKPFAAGEPNFYKINEKYPLPPQKSSMQESQKACVPTSTKSSLSLSALPLSRAENTSSAAVKPRFVPSSIQDGSIFSMNPSVKGPAATLLPYDSPELMGRSGPVFSGPSDDFENLMHLTLGHHGEQCYSSSGSTHSEYQSSDHALFQSQSPNSTLAHRTYQELPMNTSSTMFCISHPENSCCPDGPFRREYIEDPFEPLPLS